MMPATKRQIKPVRLNQDFQKAFSKVDFIATPVTTTLPFLIGEKNLDPLKMYLLDLITIPPNLGGFPKESVCPLDFLQLVWIKKHSLLAFNF